MRGKYPVKKATHPSDQLINAAEKGDVVRCAALIAEGKNVNATDAREMTALHYAAKKGHTEVCKLLVENGADINSMTAGEFTALHMASTCGHTKTVVTLLEMGAKTDVQAHCSALHEAATSNHPEICKALINGGADVGARALELRGATALHFATSCQSSEVCLALIENGANVNAVDRHGDTALHEAVRYRSSGVITILIEKGADINLANIYGETPLFLAARHSDGVPIVEHLIKNDADVNKSQSCENNWTALHMAASRGNAEVCVTLLKHNANPSLTDVFNKTALDLAVSMKLDDCANAMRTAIAAQAARQDLESHAGKSASAKLSLQ